MSFMLNAQRSVDREGVISFFSTAPLEDIRAESAKAIGIIDLETGEVAVSIPMSSFEFPKKLMQEHFNDNYIESEKYPRATLVGSLVDWNKDDLNGTMDFDFMGELEIHGVKQPLSTVVQISENGEILNVQSKFNVRLEDHDIDIPTIVIEKIAEVVEVTATFKFELNP